MNSFEIKSVYTNYSYRISIYLPKGEPPKDGYPVVYILDGRNYFDFAKQVVRLQSRNAKKTGIQEAIVVGICHREENERIRRFYDFTAPAGEYSWPDHTKGRITDIKELGGAAKFSRFIEEELKPRIESRFKVDQNKQAIYGHSLGGYFVLWSYLTKPQSFQTFLAVSPSLWWNEKELFRYASETDRSELNAVSVIVGEREGFMVEQAKEFYEILPGTVRKQLYIAPEENHASVVPTTMSRAFRFWINY